MSQHSRSIRNIFVQPKFQLNLSMYYIMIGGLILNGIAFFVKYTNDQIQLLMNNEVLVDFETQIQINDLMMECFQVTLLGLVVFIIFSFGFALMMSHRIAGPQVAILAYIDALKDRNYDYTRSLRSKDELTEVMAALKELGPLLKERDQASKE